MFSSKAGCPREARGLAMVTGWEMPWALPFLGRKLAGLVCGAVRDLGCGGRAPSLAWRWPEEGKTRQDDC